MQNHYPSLQVWQVKFQQITSKFPDIAAEHNYYKTKKGKMSPNETSSDKPYFTSCPNNKNNFEEILNPVSSVQAIYSGKSASPKF